MQRGESATVLARKRGEVGVGDLALSEHSCLLNICVGQIVWSEAMARIGGELAQLTLRGSSARTAFDAHDPARQCAFDDWASGEFVAQCDEPVTYDCVMHMIGVEQGNQHIGIQQERAYGASRAQRSSSS